MGLKLFRVKYAPRSITWLKSDHFGIEICEDPNLSYKIVLLKSDHFGIEIKSPTQANPTYKLKSDHHEIEMNLFFRGKY